MGAREVDKAGIETDETKAEDLLGIDESDGVV